MSSPNPSSKAEPRPSRWWDVQEWLGFACLVAFAAFIWPPAGFAVAGIVFVVTANLHAAKGKHAKRTGLLDRIARALAAYRKESSA